MSATVLYLSPESPKPWEFINNYNSKGIEPSNHFFHLHSTHASCAVEWCVCVCVRCSALLLGANASSDSTIIPYCAKCEVMQDTRATKCCI